MSPSQPVFIPSNAQSASSSLLRAMVSCPFRLLLLLSVALFLAGCSAETRKARYRQRADAHFTAGRYSEAEVEYLNLLRLDQLNVHAIARLGIIYHENGRIPRAAPFLAKAHELDPANLEVNLKLGLLHLSANNPAEAWKLALSALAQAPTNDIAPLLLAQSARGPEQITQARQHLEELMRSAGATPALKVGIGALLLREGNIEGAEAAFREAIALDPQSPSGHHALGGLFVMTGNISNAIAELKTAAGLAPLRSPQRLQYAELLGRAGQPDEAERVLTEITRGAPDFLPAWIGLAEMALARRNYDACAAHISQALARDPRHVEALLLRGRLKLVQGKLDEAIAEFGRLASIYPRSPFVRYQLGLAALRKGDTARAMVEFNAAVAIEPNYDDAVLMQAQLNLRRNNPQPAINALTDLVRRQPQLAGAHLLLAAAHVAAGDLNAALSVSRQMAELFPKSAEPLYTVGLIQQRQGNRAEARVSFEAALELAPNHWTSLEQLVEMDIADKRFSEAIERVESIAQKLPTAAEPYYLLGRIHVAQDNPESAEQALLKAIQLNPEFRPAYLLLARTYVNSGRHVQALEKLKTALAGNPADPTTLLQIAIIHDEAGNYAVAREYYERLLAANPRSSVALNNVAYLYSERLGELDKAYDAARKARELMPEDPSTADTLGWVLYKRGEYAWALALLQESAERLKNHPEVLYHLGMTHYIMGHEEPARDAFERALQIDKDFPGSAEAAQRLAILNTISTAELTEVEKLAADRPDDPIVLARLAGFYRKAGDIDRAIELYDRALQKNPRNASAAANLAQLYVGRDNDKALHFAKTARTLMPDDPRVAHTLGRIAYDSRDFAWALSLLQQCERALPNDPAVLFDLAHASFSMGRIQEAQSAMRRAQQADAALAQSQETRDFLAMTGICLDPTGAQPATKPESVLQRDPNNLPALAASGVLQGYRGEYRQAIATFTRVLELCPTFSPADKHLALLYARFPQDEARAYEHALKARRSFPDDTEVARTLGVLAHKRGDYRRAVQLLKESVSKLPTDAEAFFYLGLAHHRLGEKKESALALQKAIALDLSQPLREEAERTLSQLN
ncbi:MAG TPA: tetratricopeptide repeat protein [Verrucomicrobia bacterium]|nr:tetratricopeptide repeat protein [Verrucomicrobiota bacterium]HOP98023.1 tetratricopeptide repeat protein [Verrucomicrobiota bacterium]